MSNWRYDGARNGPSPAAALLLLGLTAAATAACLLATKAGQQVRQQLADKTADWPARAADVLAQGREKIIVAVEEQKGSASGPVRQKPL